MSIDASRARTAGRRHALRRRTSVVALLAVASGGLVAATGAAAAGTTWASVIVTGTPGSLTRVERSVSSVGGEVRRALPIVNGVTARVPARSVAALRSAPGVRSVTNDAAGHLAAVDPALGYDVTGDEGSVRFVAGVVRADQAWNKGYTGKGVDVALIDSGVAPVTGLTSGNVLHGPDLSFESQIPELAHTDTFGHGTHMASIIAGRDTAGTGSAYVNTSSHKFNGIAPDARLVSVKVASNSGAADVSQVIAAIDWVAQNAQRNGLNIKVLNLSYGTDSAQASTLDPLDYAAENAWRAGIVVVVSGGNRGNAATGLLHPATDPLVIAVGASESNNSLNTSDDVVAPFSQRGRAERHVDVVAPGMHVLGLRVPGSRLDQQNPQAVVGNRFFRGSGTSQSAAVVSGLAAVYLSRYPGTSPDSVKKALMLSADPIATTDKNLVGQGVPQLDKALSNRPPTGTQAATGATGTGSLEASRGSAHVNDGVSDLTGELDIFGNAWDATTWSANSALGRSWTDGSFNGATWTGNTWTGNTWTGATWTGNTWTGQTWTGNTWTGNTWTGNTWTGGGWTGNTWTGNTWTGNTWTDGGWSTSGWLGSTWA